LSRFAHGLQVLVSALLTDSLRFRMIGIHDVSARMPRGRNPMNSVKACIKALQSQKDPGQIALGRGQKMVDVRKVYFGEEKEKQL